MGCGATRPYFGKGIGGGKGARFGGLARKAKETELGAWERPKVSPPGNLSAESKDLVDTRWALTLEGVVGRKRPKLVCWLMGFQDPDLRDGNVDFAGCVSRRSPHLRLISLGALGKWPLRSLDIKNAFLQADGFGRVV